MTANDPHPQQAAPAPERVLATDAARALIAELQSRYGPILFHQSGGCCDGSSPMCYAQGDFMLGDRTCAWAKCRRTGSIWAPTSSRSGATPSSFWTWCPTGRHVLPRQWHGTPLPDPLARLFGEEMCRIATREAPTGGRV